jgi:hypothetical protein
MATVGVTGLGVAVAVAVSTTVGDSLTTGVPVGVETGVSDGVVGSAWEIAVGDDVAGTGARAGVGPILGHTYVKKANKHSKSSRMMRRSVNRTRKALDEFLQRSLSVLIDNTSRQLGRTN